MPLACCLLAISQSNFSPAQVELGPACLGPPGSCVSITDEIEMIHCECVCLFVTDHLSERMAMDGRNWECMWRMQESAMEIGGQCRCPLSPPSCYLSTPTTTISPAVHLQAHHQHAHSELAQEESNVLKSIICIVGYNRQGDNHRADQIDNHKHKLAAAATTTTLQEEQLDWLILGRQSSRACG